MGFKHEFKNQEGENQAQDAPDSLRAGKSLLDLEGAIANTFDRVDCGPGWAATPQGADANLGLSTTSEPRDICSD